jgi:hypothetical protein
MDISEIAEKVNDCAQKYNVAISNRYVKRVNLLKDHTHKKYFLHQRFSTMMVMLFMMVEEQKYSII